MNKMFLKIKSLINFFLSTKQVDTNESKMNLEPESGRKKFMSALYNLENSELRCNFEEYMLALLKLVQKYQHKDTTPDFVIEMLTEAYTSERHTFDNEWLMITSPPPIDKIREQNTIDRGFAVLCEVIIFQIAELHRMKENPPTTDQMMYGFVSSTGNRWVNFHPIFNLRCGMRGISDSFIAVNEITFGILALAFEYGRRYE